MEQNSKQSVIHFIGPAADSTATTPDSDPSILLDPAAAAEAAARADSAAVPATPRTWDARAARWLVTPLKNSRITPNHLTTVRLLVGAAGALAFMRGGYGWSNMGALLLVVSNFLDHTDGELARLSGKTSKAGHFYDLAADALVTVAVFVGIGIGVSRGAADLFAPPALLGCAAGAAVALIFFLRMRIEDLAGKAGTRQAFFAGLETEDVLYLMPVVTLLDGTRGFLLAAAIGAPLFALWVIFDFRRALRRARLASSPDAADYRAVP